MADQVDLCEQQNELLREAQIAKARVKIDTSNPTGRCWNCGEEIGFERRFCDRFCADQWEREHTKRK